MLRGLASGPQIELLPPGLLEVFERLLLVATSKPAEQDVVVPKAKPKSGDPDAMAVWESALTKFDCLESVFERGLEVQKLIQAELSEQVAKDLMKDYGAKEKDAQQRAKRLVATEMGKRFGMWKKSLANVSDS